MANHKPIRGYIALIFTLTLVYGFGNQAIGSLITRIIEHYGISMAEAGLTSSFSSIGNFIAIFAVTLLVGRIHKITLIGISALLYGAGLFLISLAPPYGLVLMCFALIGIVGALVDTLGNSVIADLQPEKVSRNLSILHGIFGLGGLLGPVAMEALAQTISWDQVYLILSLMYVLYVAVYAAFTRWHSRALGAHIPMEKQQRISLFDLVKFFACKRNVLLWVTMFFYGGHQIIMALWIKRYVEVTLQRPELGALALSLVWTGTALCRIVIAPSIKASSPAKVFFGNIIAAVMLGAGLLHGSAAGILAASTLVGLSSGLSLPLVIATGCEWYPGKTALGTMMPFTAFFIACVAFPPVSGWVSDLWGIPWGVAVGALCAVLVALFSGMLWLMLRREAAVIGGEA